MLVLAGGSASAATDQQASLQDNRLLLSSNASTVSETVQTLKLLGVDRLMVAVPWDRVAPDPSSRHVPAGFNGAEPADYPAAGWTRFDRILAQAAAAGMSVNFDLSGGAPLWADKSAPAPSMLHAWYPSATEFGKFAYAVGKRYSGRYTPPGASSPLPRVSDWSIWNEPNVGSSSLSPQTLKGIEVAPSLYRSLLDAAWQGLNATGHRPATDTIIVGQLASTGHLHPGLELGMQPLRFLRALYCVDTSYRPLQGSEAAVRACPTTPVGSRQFPSQHPALFLATGWGHHPYSLQLPQPDLPPPSLGPDWVTFAVLPRLENALDRIQRVYGSSRRLPLYLTEYGIETNPPNPEFPTSPTQQGIYLNQAEYIAWKDPRVRTFPQYLLQDAPPLGHATVSSFATGVEFLGGAPKASFAAYRMPIWMPATSANQDQPLEVWGDVRPAKRYPHFGPPVRIQLDGRTIRSLALTNPEGYFDVHVAFPHSGTVRLAWTYPNGPTIFSRPVAVRVTSGGGSAVGVVAAACGVVLILGGIGTAVRLRRR